MRTRSLTPLHNGGPSHGNALSLTSEKLHKGNRLSYQPNRENSQ